MSRRSAGISSSPAIVTGEVSDGGKGIDYPRLQQLVTQLRGHLETIRAGDPDPSDACLEDLGQEMTGHFELIRDVTSPETSGAGD